MSDPSPYVIAAAVTTPVAAYDRDESRPALQRQLSIQQAIAEGHDADIPSDIGVVLDEQGEKRLHDVIAVKRRNSLALRRSHSVARSLARDVEREAGTETDGHKSEEPDATSSDDDSNVVWWDGEDDPQNPYNWPTWVKVVNCAFVSAMTFIAPLGSSIFAPGVGLLMYEFHSGSRELASFVVSVYVLGFAAGPLVIAPLSEIYGRLALYHACNIAFMGFLVGCALAPSLNALIVFRFLAGVFGSCALANGGGSIADMIHPEKRATAMAAFGIGPLLGPIIGPVAGGFLAGAKGWRWVFWLLVIIVGALTVAMFIFARESYAPVLLQRKVDRLRKETGNDLLRSKLDAGLSRKDYFKRSIIRPLRLLVKSPICTIFALYTALVYGYLYLMFTTISEVFIKSYNFTTSTVGLVFIGLGVGCLIGMFYYSVTSNRLVQKKLANKDGPPLKPEDRLVSLPVGAIVFPIGFFIYGWTAQYQVHWIVPILAHMLIGIGNIIIFMALSTALLDMFNMYAASALAANTVVRSVFGAVLPLAGLQMYDALGLGWGNSLLGFVAAAMIPGSFLIVRYSEMLRIKYEIKDL
ncbi:major facilitator superfamily domain-containing protein [Podospora appendiculata]|uniref:Major facilitator superfamily domain-containing protein n=1 Tax=Podospora appendiculata TaxID=314037 RepID=A0AAE0XBV3_9PEZI|nr:major facilitator superfamily domain-containing protein [Podospora appendiculata]